MMRYRILLVALLLVLLAGCAPLERMPDEAPAERPAPPSAEEPVPDAVAGLLSEAEAASAAGDQERAAALLERAIGIAPDEAALWHNLAIVRYRQGAYGQAEQMALRADGLAGDDRRLRATNWRLIAAARERQGDDAGAGEAEARAAGLQSGE